MKPLHLTKNQMKKTTYLLVLILISSNILCAQSIDDAISQKKTLKDLECFINIRESVNSGLYTYRTKEQIDSTYSWAFKEIPNVKTYRDFYNLLTVITDYEGSLHNSTYWPDKLSKTIKNESKGYFPIPLKVIRGKLRVNIKGARIPLGSEIISINGHSKERLLRELGKYYTTDGFNKTGKKTGISKHFSKYYRYNFGLNDDFEVVYKKPRSKKHQSIKIINVSYKKYYQNFDHRNSFKIDRQLYEHTKKSDYYSLSKLNATTAILTINSYSIGNANSKSHLKYKRFLDSIFIDLNQRDFKNLIVDIRNNGGGDAPNDMITLSYLVNAPQKEIRTAWVSFTESIPYWKHFQLDIPFYLKPFAKGKLKKMMKEELPIVKNNRRYYKNIVTYQPNINRFKGQVYLLTSPYVASAASLFASMLASNSEAIVIGEETSGGYYGHNGSFSVVYKLPKSKFSTSFSIVNLTQDVVMKDTQPVGRGVMPDFKVEQSFNDFIDNKDTQMNFTIDLIKKNMQK